MKTGENSILHDVNAGSDVIDRGIDADVDNIARWLANAWLTVS